MTIAEYIADRLYKLGVRHIFGIPGGPSIPYIEAYRNAGIEYIVVSQEAAAGVMASVTGRLTGIPGICHATSGPGATNLSTGVGCAFLDRSPVIAFTDEVGENMLIRTTQMNIDHQKLFAPITKSTFRLNHLNAIEVIGKAESICRQEYPGPVHIGLPANLAGEKINITAGESRQEKLDRSRGSESELFSMIRKSSRPLIAMGLTSARLLSQSGILSCLEKLRIPVVVTPMAKGIIPENHPCYAGVLFHAMSGRLKLLTGDSDLIIGLGYDPVEYNYESWIPDVPLIHFNTVKTDFPAKIQVKEYISPPESWLAILNSVDPQGFVSRQDTIHEVRDNITAEYEKSVGFGPVRVIKIIQEEVPEDSFLTADVGSHLHVIGQYWLTGGKKNLLMTNGWSGMGFGIPAALAVKLSMPSSTVVCLSGDGGFLMTAGEIMTARRYNLAVVVAVLSDGELNLIRLKKSWRNLSPYGTSLYSGDLFGTDTFLGVPVFECSSENEMRLALRSSMKLSGPAIINARIDPADYGSLISERG